MRTATRILIAAGTMFVFVSLGAASGATPAGGDNVTMLLLLGLCVGGLAYGLCSLLSNEKLIFVGVALVAVVAGMFIRFMSLYHITSDYYSFLAPWAQTFREHGWRAITMSFADYNMPYLYFVAIIAKIPIRDLYTFKLLSILFDGALVLASLHLGKTLGLKGLRLALLASAVWLAPTVWLNSAFWGQCDSIYVFFVIMALATALEDKPAHSMIFAAIAFSFKLQTVFILPVYLVFWAGKKLKLWHFAVFPAAYLVTILPAWVSGKPFFDILSVYLHQTETYSNSLNMNSPSMYALYWGGDQHHDVFFNAGLVMAVCFVCFVCAWMYTKRDRLSRRALTLCALLLALGVPWLLPSMHERYFYMADILCIVTAILIPRRWYLAPFCIFASYAGYHAYLYLTYLPYVGLLVPSLVVLWLTGTVAFELWREVSPEEPETLPEPANLPEPAAGA